MTKEKYQVGDLFLFKDWSLFGLIVRLFTRKRYSHISCYIGNGLYVESNLGGVRLMPIQVLEQRNYDVYRHKTASKRKLKEATEWMVKQCGKNYDYLGLIGIGLVFLKKKEVK